MKMIADLDVREKRRFLIEAVITLVAMVLIYFGFLFFFNKLLNPHIGDVFYGLHIKERFGITGDIITFYQNSFTFTMFLVTLLFVKWRLSRLYRRFELNHLLQELDYIAKGNYHHRLSQDNATHFTSVITSVNKLVDSTVQAMAEERAVEQSKSELITNMSHDIRTPLTSVIGYLGLIEENPDVTVEDMRAYVHIAYQKSQQIKKMADDLFEYAQVSDYQEAVHYQDVPIKNFLDQVSAEYEYEAKQKGMQLDVICANDMTTVRMDAEKMARVYDNLLTNAFKYSDATQLVLRAEMSKDDVVLTVENNGVRIPKKAQQQLFTRFYRQDKARSTQGTGLGLAIAERILLLHQGSIRVISHDKQTIFEMRLPK